MNASNEHNQQPEGLQKLTDSPVNNTAESFDDMDIIKQISRKHRPKNNSQEEYNRCENRIVEEAIEHPLLSETNKKGLRSQLWERNHRALITAINNFMSNNNLVPSVSELANMTGLSRETVYKHLGNFTKDISYHAQLEQFQLVTSQVLTKLFNLAVGGDVKAAKVYLDAVGRSNPKQQKSDKLDASNSNYIQINNRVKIDQVTFAMLPDQVQQQIADLFLQGLQHKMEDNQDLS